MADTFYSRHFHLTYFTGFSHCISGNETMGVILVFGTLLVLAAIYQFLGSIDLTLADSVLIIPVLYRV